MLERRRLRVAGALLLLGALTLAPALVPADLLGFLGGESAAAERAQFDHASNRTGLTYNGTRDQPGVRGDVSNSGVYVADVNRDGWPDVLAVGGRHPTLFVNRNGSFEAERRFDPGGYVRAALFFDANADGRPDLLLTPLNRTPVLYLNGPEGFRRVEAGFERPLPVPTGASAADYDGDGCLDLFVFQNGDWLDRRPERLTSPGLDVAADNGNPNLLYRGDCRGGFDHARNLSGAGEHWSLAASFTDFTGDGRPDVHVANDFDNDTLYVNRGDGEFAGRQLPQTNRNGMSSEVADVNRDGRPDLFVTNIYWTRSAREVLDATSFAMGRIQGNNLLLNRENGTFRDAAREWGVLRGRWGWAAVIADLDNDGDRDLFHTTRGRYVPALGGAVDLSRLRPFKRPRLYERSGPRNFSARDAGEAGFGTTDGRGLARLDYDRDGDQDLLIANATGRFRLYENRRAPGSALELRLRRPDGPVLGATVRIVTEERVWNRTVTARADFLSQDSRVVHVGLGDAERVRRVEITWPDGSTTTLTDVRADRFLVVSPSGTANKPI